MAKTVGIDQEKLDKATKIYRRDGMELNEAIEKLFDYTIKLNKFPIEDTSVDVKNIRRNTKINSEMCEEVWKQFIDAIVNDSFEFNYISKVIEANCGMSKGSAFIYLTILRNMCSGVVNTRNMKIEDLKFFMGKVKVDLDDDANANMVESLNESIKYWKEKIPGDYAKKVEKLVEEFHTSTYKMTASEILGKVEAG